MEGPRSMVEDLRVGPIQPRLAVASYVAKSDSCEYCSVDIVLHCVQEGRMKPDWGNASCPRGSTDWPSLSWLQYSHVLQLCDMFKPMLLNVFKNQHMTQMMHSISGRTWQHCRQRPVVTRVLLHVPSQNS
jgi:hypothetical protein